MRRSEELRVRRSEELHVRRSEELHMRRSEELRVVQHWEKPLEEHLTLGGCGRTSGLCSGGKLEMFLLMFCPERPKNMDLFWFSKVLY